MKSVAGRSLDFTSLFEAELFVRLMLWRWKHPHADDAEFANGLLEDASAALRGALQGQQFIESIAAEDLNFVAAVWYAEYCCVDLDTGDREMLMGRREWLSAVRRALPSCFCDPEELTPS